MLPTDHHAFTSRLTSRLLADPRVLGLVALGSMSGEPPPPDRFSDHDFFVITRPGAQEGMRAGLSWLPEAESLALSFRETAHGVKALYLSGALLEFAVFDLAELELARVNRFAVLFDRTGGDAGPQAGQLSARLGALRARTASEAAAQRPDPRWLLGQLLTDLLVGAGRHARGERLAGRARVQEAAERLARLCGLLVAPERPEALDSLDPLRRFEQAFPALGAGLEQALEAPVPEGARRILALARSALAERVPDFPRAGFDAVERALAELRP